MASLYTTILTNVYYDIIYPFLLYAITVWGSASKNPIPVWLATFKDSYPQIPDPLEHTPLFHKLNQFGFRKNNSTTFALLEITEKIKETIDNKKYGCGIFIDLRKAFDTVNHEILLKKLGIRGKGLGLHRT